MRFQRTTLIALAAMMTAFGATAAELGDDAADLQIAKWVKGEPVKIKDSDNDKIHVVEFWATWCGPCRTSIPHLTELQEKYKDDVVFIGISDETAAEVQPFVENMGEKMEYRVALDEGRKTSQAYMQAYNQNGIPTAFVVDRAGKIVWYGHPMAQLESVLDQMVAGTFDMSAMQNAAEAEKMLPQFAQLIMSGEEADKAEADKLGAKIVELASGNPELLNRIAWALFTDESIKYRNTELAMKAATKAFEATKGEDANVLDTYARGLYETGDLEGAIKHQEQAVEKSADPGMKAELEKTLEQYKAEANN